MSNAFGVLKNQLNRIMQRKEPALDLGLDLDPDASAFKPQPVKLPDVTLAVDSPVNAPPQETSALAAVPTAVRGTQRNCILAAFYRAWLDDTETPGLAVRGGLTDEEAAAAANIGKRSTPEKRRKELCEAPFCYLADSGTTRKSSCGYETTVWYLTHRGLAYCRAQDAGFRTLRRPGNGNGTDVQALWNLIATWEGQIAEATNSGRYNALRECVADLKRLLPAREG